MGRDRLLGETCELWFSYHALMLHRCREVVIDRPRLSAKFRRRILNLIGAEYETAESATRR